MTFDTIKDETLTIFWKISQKYLKKYYIENNSI